MVSLLLVANVVNLGADLSAMGAALALLSGRQCGPLHPGLWNSLHRSSKIGSSYPRYASILKWTTLSLFTYVGVVLRRACAVGARAYGRWWCRELQWNAAYATALVAILGTTISPYLFFWQAGQEIEEAASTPCQTTVHHTPGRRARAQAHSHRYSCSAWRSAPSSPWPSVFATAATLHASGVRDIATSSQAAEALRPIAGHFAFRDVRRWHHRHRDCWPCRCWPAPQPMRCRRWPGKSGSLDAKPLDARLFYATIAVTTLAGAHRSIRSALIPREALYWAAVVNGILAAPLMAVMMLIVRNPRAMGRLTVSRRTMLLGWAATAVMFAASALFLAFIVADWV